MAKQIKLSKIAEQKKTNVENEQIINTKIEKEAEQLNSISSNENSINNETKELKNDKINLEDLTIFELNQYEKAVQTICIKYEKLSHMNMGSYDERSHKEMMQATNILTKYHEKYEKIINEIQKRIDIIL